MEPSCIIGNHPVDNSADLDHTMGFGSVGAHSATQVDTTDSLTSAGITAGLIPKLTLYVCLLMYPIKLSALHLTIDSFHILITIHTQIIVFCAGVTSPPSHSHKRRG